MIIFILIQLQQQTRFDFAQNYDITTINAKKSVLDGIGHVAGIVDNDKLIVDQRCKESLCHLDQYQWDPNPNLLKEKPKHNMHRIWLMHYDMRCIRSRLQRQRF